jgi:hypothetical protein
MAWPETLPAVQVRIARQTDQLEEIRRFYVDGLGLPIIGQFAKHAAYDGLMIGLPNYDYHLEFVQHEHGSSGKAPSKENLLVFYIPDANAVKAIAGKLQNMGYQAVPSENPWWDEHGAITIEDPDGWRIVLQAGYGLGSR